MWMATFSQQRLSATFARQIWKWSHSTNRALLQLLPSKSGNGHIQPRVWLNKNIKNLISYKWIYKYYAVAIPIARLYELLLYTQNHT